ncbi:hypothetical protein [Micromonospora sp. WMMD1082]|uniref:hypothetical protein n=1 Tax=Micromonospora sp. WMMD1082 TaxID=3016104 RepID=UPI002416B7EC|nr:hypothetical protein [Micromonospora sp. WMMD1082]MDG4794838.1 hypothetical protein [Micromonospora sp. WMMD1082]
MTEAARKVAEEAGRRFDNLAEDVRKKFDRITSGRLSDQAKTGRFGGRGGHGAGQARTDQHRRQRGGSAR